MCGQNTSWLLPIQQKLHGNSCTWAHDPHHEHRCMSCLEVNGRLILTRRAYCLYTPSHILSLDCFTNTPNTQIKLRQVSNHIKLSQCLGQQIKLYSVCPPCKFLHHPIIRNSSWKKDSLECNLKNKSNRLQ